MQQNDNNLISSNRIFIWIALVTGAMLLIPLIAMRFTAAVAWNGPDFIVMGFLISGSASLFVLAARRAPRKHRLLIGGMFIAATLFVWMELAVGVFTNLGS